MAKLKVVHYINQFFAQIGGEEKADYPAELRVGEIVGPGQALTQSFVATLISMRTLRRQRQTSLLW